MTNQNDFVIDNGTGFAVRQDIQDALQALAGNSSGNSEPGVTYAYQWWADSNAGIMKMRNSANNAWIDMLNLDGTFVFDLEDGSAASPSLRFADDQDTGIFSAAVNQINLTAAGVSRLDISNDNTVFNESGANVDFRVEGNSSTHLLFLDAGNDRVGIKASSPATPLQVGGDIYTTTSLLIRISSSTNNLHVHQDDSDKSIAQFTNTATGSGASDGFQIGLSSTEQGLINMKESASILFKTADTDAMTIDSSQRVGIGTTSPTALLDVRNNNVAMRLSQSATNYFEIARSSSDGHYRITTEETGSSIIFKTDNDGNGAQNRLEITRNGAVLIGASSAGNGVLVVQGTSNAYGGVGNATTACGAIIQAQDDQGRTIQMVAPGSAAEGGIGSLTNHNFTIFVSNTEKARFMSLNLSDPAFCIGRTNNTVNGLNFGHVLFYDGAVGHFRDVTGANTVLRAGGNQGQVNVFGDGDLTNNNNSYGQASDETLKQDIVDAASQWNDIKGLRVRKFRFKDNPTGVLQIGVVAQEIETVSAGLVQEDKEGIKSVKYSVLYMKAVKCLQEAISKIEVLETKVAALEAA